MAVLGRLSLNFLKLGFPFRVESVLKEIKIHCRKLKGCVWILLVQRPGLEWLWWEEALCFCVMSMLFWGRFRFLCDPPGLTVEWTEDSLQQGQRISVPEYIYNDGCVKDVDEGLEVNTPGGIRCQNLLIILVAAETSKVVCLSFAPRQQKKLVFPWWSKLLKAVEGKASGRWRLLRTSQYFSDKWAVRAAYFSMCLWELCLFSWWPPDSFH